MAKNAKKQYSMLQIPQEIMGSWKLIGNLSRNDFKKKFAGSYLGIIWAFVQPVVTVFMYWFVFEKALSVGTQSTKAGIAVPYVLWLIAGLVPWFFFSEALSSGTRTMLDYSFLVKKVVFKIGTLPLVKVISGLFVHAFFLIFMVCLYTVYGMFPGIFLLQILYYSFAMILMTAGLCYGLSAIAVFFKDLVQMVNILLQVLIWMTPIMWNMDAVHLPVWAVTILKMNPMYYIVNGYRDSMVNGVWFWERPFLTLYFWGFTLVAWLIGMSLFQRLRTHFADVL